ncbi:MAG: alpha/beta hydrolase [Deltaproteobacteria bacterium]|nr:alpha/beta hydrolase [Deltaproteobacteria bacterium]
MPDKYVRGRRLGYGVQPTDFDKSSLVLLFIHGSGGDREDWQGQLDGLSTLAGVIALELPGHGASDPPGETSVQSYTDWVVDFVSAMKLSKVFVIGCSLGSAIAQLIALSTRPWLVGIGLVGAGARLKVHPAVLDGLRRDKEKALAMLADYCLSPATGHPLRQEISQKFLLADPELIHGDLSGCNEFDVLDQIQAINIPTWIIVGQDDRLTPPKYAHFLHSAISGSELAMVPDAGHLVMMEKPSEFNRRLADFLARRALL